MELKEVIKQVEATGISVRLSRDDLRTRPIAELVFQLSPNRKTLTFQVRSSRSPNNFKLEVIDKNKKTKQVLLCLEEPARKVEQNSSFTRSIEVRKLNQKVPADLTYIKEQLIRYAALPRLSFEERTVVRNIDEFNVPNASMGYIKYTGTVVRTSPASKEYFLVGFDEEHMFITNLPKAVKTISEAIQSLTPAELLNARGQLRKNVLRQGEFFFVPATSAEMKQIKSNKKLEGPRVELRNNEHRYTDHKVGGCINLKQTRFVTGVVVNPRHKTLWLDGWYRVMNNLEKESADSWD